jgi:ubiquinone/menaquinone biosynthesis C-methylase UbiE
MEFIKQYWEAQGRAHGDAHKASWGDHFAISLEIETISRHIKSAQKVLDVGCANGYSTFRQFELQPHASFTGVDYAAAMIDHANRSKTEKTLADDQVAFQVASIQDLPFPGGVFDVVYTTRVLINLPTWEQQLRGIEECLRVAKPGGKVVLSEAFWEPLCRLNGIRLLLDLPPLVEHDFNRYLKKGRLDAWLEQQRLAFEVEEFSSVYYLGSRCLREYFEGSDIVQSTYDLPLNRTFYELERRYSANGVSVQQAYVISK